MFGKGRLNASSRGNPAGVPRKNIIRRYSLLRGQSGQGIFKTGLFQNRQGFLAQTQMSSRMNSPATTKRLQAVGPPVLQRGDLFDKLPGRFLAGIAALNGKNADIFIAQANGGEGETARRVEPRFCPRKIGPGLGENRDLAAGSLVRGSRKEEQAATW